MSQASDTKVAKRYAGALFAAARQLGRTEVVQRDLDTLLELWDKTPLPRALESPKITTERKHAIIDIALKGNIDSLSVQFVHLLIDKRREQILPTVQGDYRRLADEAAGLIRATATVASSLDDGQQASLVAGLSARTGKRIELTVNVDPNIIGGVIVRMNDTVIDGSVRGSLERIREQMMREL